MENLVQNLVSALHSGKAEDYEKILLDTTAIDEVEQKQHITQDGETIADYFIDDVHITLQSPFVGCFYFVDFQTFSTLQSPYNQKY